MFFIWSNVSEIYLTDKLQTCHLLFNKDQQALSEWLNPFVHDISRWFHFSNIELELWTMHLSKWRIDTQVCWQVTRNIERSIVMHKPFLVHLYFEREICRHCTKVKTHPWWRHEHLLREILTYLLLQQGNWSNTTWRETQ